MGLEVLLYVPNIIGHVRVTLLIASWTTYYSHPVTSISLYCISALLDACDGYAARKLNQTSDFGAWYDVLIDITGRGMLWSRIYHFGYLAACLEWVTFTCTHNKGSGWKSAYLQEPWFLAKAVMANDFRTPMGFLAVGGLHILPVWLYAHYTLILNQLQIPMTLQYIGIAAFASGRAICAFVEVWVIWKHINDLCAGQDVQA